MSLTTMFKSVLFTIFVPGTVSFVIPYLLTTTFSDKFNIEPTNLIGLLIMLFGIFLYVMSVLSFIQQGGTPQIYFMKKLEKVFGLEPNQLANNGIYTFSRNPMYTGVFLTTLGIGIFIQSLLSVIWAIIFFGLTNLVVIFIEEPHLKEKHGQEYIDYFNKTPRWFGFKKKK